MAPIAVTLEQNIEVQRQNPIEGSRGDLWSIGSCRPLNSRVEEAEDEAAEEAEEEGVHGISLIASRRYNEVKLARYYFLSSRLDKEDITVLRRRNTDVRRRTLS